MATFNELMQKMVNEDYDTLVKFAQASLVRVMPQCKAVDKEHDGMFMAVSLILTAIAADGVLTGLEKRFLADALGMDKDTVQKFIALYDSRMDELVDKFADSLSTEGKADVMMLVTCVAAVDEKISKDETAFIKKLMA